MRCGTCDSLLSPTETGDIFCPRCTLASAVAFGQPVPDSLRPNVAGYETISELGRGAMGVVWLARDVALDRLVALKRIDSSADPRLGARLLREGRAVAQLKHPHIVTLFALGEAPGGAFLAMELLEGGDLQARLKEQLPPPRQAAGLTMKIADALAHAHAAGVLHRDVKPSNILLDAADEPHLADFGLAAPLLGGGDITAYGQVVGTPAFLAPELLQGVEQASPQSDIYGVGAVLYACLTGRPPFVGENVAVILAQIAASDPPPPRFLNPAAPRDLQTICLACLEKTPSRRYASAGDLRDDLRRFLDGEPIHARPPGLAGKTVRWCRRKPALAATGALAAVLVLVLAIGGPVLALRMARARDAAETSRRAALTAEAKTREQLREALLARSQATRLTGARGQRHEALAAAEQAARIRPGVDARDEAIAALALPDITQVREWALRQSLRQRVVLAPEHDRYFLTPESGDVAVHRLSDGALLRGLHGAARPLAGPRLSPDGRWLVVRDEKARVVAWRGDEVEPAFVLPERPYVLRGVLVGYGQPDAFSPSADRLASAGPGHGVTLHATDDGRELKRIVTATEATHVAFSFDGKLLALGDGRGLRGPTQSFFLSVHDAETGAEMARAAIATPYQSIAWSGDSRMLLVGSANGFDLFEARTGNRLRTIHDPRAQTAMFGPPGTAITANQGGTITVWDLTSGRSLLSASLGGQPEIGIDRSGTLIAKATIESGRLFRLEMPAVVRSIPSRASPGFENVTNHGGSVLEYSRDGRWIATAVWGAVQLRHSATGELAAVLPLGSGNNACSVRFAPAGGSLLVSCRELGLIRVTIEQESEQVQLVMRDTIDDERDFMLADLSPDGVHAALVSSWRSEAKIVALDASAPTVRWKQEGAGRAVFLAGGREILVNSTHEMGRAALLVRSAITGGDPRPLGSLTHGYSVRASPDGRWLAVGTSPKSSVLVPATGVGIAPLLPDDSQGAAKITAFSGDGEWLAIASGSRVSLMRLRDGVVVAHLQTPAGGSYVPDLAFSPDVAQLAVFWENGTLTLWDLRALRRELASRGLDW